MSYMTHSTPTTPTRLPYVIVAAVVLAAVAAGIWYLRPTTAAHTSIAPTTNAAIVKCRDLVRTRLKSPGTAKFGDEKFTPDSAKAGRVTGWVDSENGFSALVRNRYVCAAYLGDTWFVQDVTFSDW